LRNVRSEKAVGAFNSGTMQISDQNLFRRIGAGLFRGCRPFLLRGRCRATPRKRNDGQAVGDQPPELPDGDCGDEKELKREPRQTNILPAHAQLSLTNYSVIE